MVSEESFLTYRTLNNSVELDKWMACGLGVSVAGVHDVAQAASTSGQTYTQANASTVTFPSPSAGFGRIGLGLAGISAAGQL